MKFTNAVFILCLACCVTQGFGRIIGSPTLRLLAQSPVVVLVPSDSLIQDWHTNGDYVVAENAQALKSQEQNRLRFFNNSDIPKSPFLLIFLNKNEKGLAAETWGSIIGISENNLITADKFESMDALSTLFLDLLLAPKQSASSLEMLYLLADAPPEVIAKYAPRLVTWAKDQKNRISELGVLNLLLRGEGVEAFDMVPLTEPDSKSPPDSVVASNIAGSIQVWITKHANKEDYPKLIKFALSQSSDLRARTLINVSDYATPPNAKCLLETLKSDPDIMVKYGCLQNLCVAYEVPIPTFEEFQKDSAKFINQCLANVKAGSLR